ncbi:DHS-like NAD/FAD-binding domain-containing protein [Scheffersomyces xylosifermentans]|uniref:DHS-like NAD/FAD-binding domain-containing protein n=1 Tax=Scheffersomyces xylosifermentans TaxID=1304137 RepID=UPI00315D3230
MPGNELVLIDSDSDHGISDNETSTRPPSKKHKPVKLGSLSVTPFKDGSSSSEEEDEDKLHHKHNFDDGHSNHHNHKAVRSGNKEHHQPHITPNYTHFIDNNDDDDEIEALSVPSSLAPFNSHTNSTDILPKAPHSNVTSSGISTSASTDSESGDTPARGIDIDISGHPGDLEGISDESDDSLEDDEDLEPISFGQIDEIPPQTIVETRRYLKQHGNLKFLEKFLPTAASSEDIIKLILQLGFIPRDLPSPTNANIMDLIRILNHAMIKVKSIRERLDTVKTIDDVLEQINKAKKILIITGAGISTSLGIPDFRSSKGFYSMVQHLGLSDPQEVFDLDIFHTDPSLFYSIAYMILPPEKIYSPLHSFITVLQKKGKLLRNYTQNIDNLESYAGVKAENLIQCHGSFATATCVTCKYQVKGEKIAPQIREKEIPYCPRCIKARKALLKKDDDAYIPESFGVFKPDITFFGEPLPKTFHDTIGKDLAECDLLISVGTSLKVAPVADIVDKVPESVPQILINKDPIDHCNFDVSLLGYCDDVASYLANRLGDSWALPHEDYDTIRGTNPNGSNLELDLVDVDFREYQIYNKSKPEEMILDEKSESLSVGDLEEEGAEVESRVKVENVEEEGEEVGEVEDVKDVEDVEEVEGDDGVEEVEDLSGIPDEVEIAEVVEIVPTA